MTEIIAEIDEQMIMKVVQKLIRCKDCKYYQHGNYTGIEWKWCMQWHNDTDENVYCSLAKRKEEKR